MSSRRSDAAPHCTGEIWHGARPVGEGVRAGARPAGVEACRSWLLEAASASDPADATGRRAHVRGCGRAPDRPEVLRVCSSMYTKSGQTHLIFDRCHCGPILPSDGYISRVQPDSADFGQSGEMSTNLTEMRQARPKFVYPARFAPASGKPRPTCVPPLESGDFGQARIVTPQP